jgi:GH18 family chitinase
LTGDLKFLSSIKTHNPSLKVLVSLRPAEKSFTLEPNVTSSSSPSSSIKHKFAKRLKDFLARHEVDGVDLDWEFFREADKSTHGREALVSLVRILKTYLSPSSLVTVTSSKFPRDLTDNYDFANLHRYVGMFAFF